MKSLRFIANQKDVGGSVRPAEFASGARLLQRTPPFFSVFSHAVRAVAKAASDSSSEAPGARPMFVSSASAWSTPGVAGDSSLLRTKNRWCMEVSQATQVV